MHAKIQSTSNKNHQLSDNDSKTATTTCIPPAKYDCTYSEVKDAEKEFVKYQYIDHLVRAFKLVSTNSIAQDYSC